MLQEFKSAGGRPSETREGIHTSLPASQKEAAEQAGLSEHQRVTAIRVRRTIERLAEKGVIASPPLVDVQKTGGTGLGAGVTGDVLVAAIAEMEMAQPRDAADAAYVIAGYAPNDGNARRLKGNEAVCPLSRGKILADPPQHFATIHGVRVRRGRNITNANQSISLA